MHAVFVKVCGLEGTAVSVGAGLGTGILEGNPPSFYAPSTDSFFGEGGCVAPAVRSGTGRHTFRRRPNGVVSIFSRRFFELARSIFTRSGGTFSSTFFRSFRPLSHARFARFVVRETHTDAQTRQAFFSVSIGVLTDEWLREKEGLAAKERSCAPERCCLLIRRLSET